MADAFAAPRHVLQQALDRRAFPAACVEAGNATRPLWRESFGRLTFDAESRPAAEDTVFDLASLTKVLATTTLVMLEVERGSLGLDDPVVDYFPAWRGGAHDKVSLRDLLSHSSGLPAHRRYFEQFLPDPASLPEDARRAGLLRSRYEQAICAEAPDYPPRSTSVYSDLGFMLLGFLLGRGASLSERFDALRAHLGAIQDLQFHPPALWRPRTAPTEFDPWRRRSIVGEVHDENAFALGGEAGHAGVFGTVDAVGEYARHLLQVLDGRTGVVRRETLLEFVTRRADVPGSRALGWDTMLPTSSCGSKISPRAFGHTGFTGTSLWIDPDRGAYVVLLTNRVHPSRENTAIQRVRPALHDAVIDALDRQ